MPHEVVKVVRGRRYRYRVENYRDPETGKVRGRWTYLGRDAAVAPAGDPAVTEPLAPRRDPARTRTRLLDALARLLERDDFEAITAGAVAVEAGLAHGTFYRHFTGKNEAMSALLEEVRATVARGRPDFEGPLGDVAAERARVSAWVAGTFGGVLERAGVVRAYYAHGSRDPAIAAAKLERRIQQREGFVRYFVRLNEAGLAAIARPEELAAALLALVDGALHVAILERRPFDPHTIAGARDVFDRAIFTRTD